MTKQARDPRSDIPALKAKIRDLLGDDALAYADLQLPQRTGNDGARRKHNMRTARYKTEKALRLAPDSEAVSQACAYTVFTLLGGSGSSTERLLGWILDDLAAAGYDREESEAAILRLKQSASDRKAIWQKRTRQRLGRKAMDALRAAQRPEQRTR